MHLMRESIVSHSGLTPETGDPNNNCLGSMMFYKFSINLVPYYAEKAINYETNSRCSVNPEDTFFHFINKAEYTATLCYNSYRALQTDDAGKGIKVNFTLEHTMKAKKGSRIIALLLL